MANRRDKDLLKSGDPGEGWQGKIGKTFADSTPWWRPPLQAPKGAPNIVVILLDDLGFAECGCYGSEIQTPNIDALAAGGVRLNNYTTVPMCAPARAGLLTGKNPHSVGVGWLTHNNPGYPGYQAGEISRDAPTFPEILRDAGYSTYAVGKWHNTADFNVSAGADRSGWPLQRGFDRYYGFMGAETNYFAPGQIVEGNELSTIEGYDDDYYSTDDFATKAISWIKAHRSSCPDKPFLMYFATNAPHTPHHAKPEDMAKYKGVYDAGWDALRESRYAHQKEMGIIGADWELPRRTPGVPAWDDMPKDRLDIMAAYMEIYAGLVDNTDKNIGRIVDTLRELDILDNTLIIVTSDNGASSIGGDDGAANFAEKRVLNNEDSALARSMLEQGKLGSVNSSPAYPKGWGNAGNTPFRFFKRTPMNGGIRVPFVAHWPERIKDAGAVRSEWVHVTDFMPAVLEILGQDYPEQFAGYRTRTLDGVSMLDILLDPKAKTKRQVQYYELEGNRGYIAGKWKIASLQPPGAKLDLDNWVLFDIENDPTEVNNLISEYPEIARELIEKYDADAFANYAYPIDNRTLIKAMTHDPYEMKRINRDHVFYQNCETHQALMVSPLVADRDFVMTCSFCHAEGQEGVLFALGDSLRGFCAFVKDGQVVVHYNGGFLVKRDLRLPVQEGPQMLTIRHTAKGKLQGAAEITLDAPRLDAPQSGTLNMSPTILKLNGEGLDVGLDRRTKVSAECEGRGSFKYAGRIDFVRIAPGPQAPGSFVNLAEELAQRDW